MNLLINARFTTRAPSGVDRMAYELSNALWRLQSMEGSHSISALAPHGALQFPLAHRETSTKTPPSLGLLWEQGVLPLLAHNFTLLSFCNSGPVLKRDQVVFLHDAQVFQSPESYSRGFRLWYRFLHPQLAKSASKIITVSEFSKSELVKFHIAPQEKIRVIHNGADHILRHTSDRSILRRNNLSEGGYFLALHGAHRHKNMKTLLQAADQTETKLPLVIAGHVPEPKTCKKHPKVKWIGRVTDAELRALYEGARAFVLPSKTEGFGLPLAEAMFCNCPVIAANAGALPEISGGHALFCDPRSIAPWSRAMDELAKNDELCLNLSNAARTHISDFTWDAAALSLLSILDATQPHVIRSNPLGA